MFAGNFPPMGWHLCDGSLLPISQFDTLFSLLGTTYGGDGQTTFGVPDLRGRVPIGQGRNNTTGTSYSLGQSAGTESVTLTINQMPAHTHTATASSQASVNDPTGAVWGTSDKNEYVELTSDNQAMNAGVVSVIGGNQPHDNMMPYLPVGFIISLYGIYPSQS